MQATSNSLSPVVSVIVTTYNRAALLQETLSSILAQTFSDYEVIVVDNMSVDDTSRYMESIESPKIRYLRNPNHGIIAVNRNLGIKLANGRYIAFCDDDDLWLPDKLKRQVALMQARPDVGLCYVNRRTFGVNVPIENSLEKTEIHKPYFDVLLWGNCIPNSGVLIKKEILDEVGLINEAAELCGVEDYEMWIRIAHKFPIAFINEVLLEVRLHPSNAGANLAKAAKKNILLFRNLKKHFKSEKLKLTGAELIQYLKYFMFSVSGR